MKPNNTTDDQHALSKKLIKFVLIPLVIIALVILVAAIIIGIANSESSIATSQDKASNPTNMTTHSNSNISDNEIEMNSSTENAQIPTTFEYTKEEYVHDLGLYITGILEGIKSFNNAFERVDKIERGTPEWLSFKEDLNNSMDALSVHSQDMLDAGIITPKEYLELHKKVVLSAQFYYDASQILFKYINEKSSESESKIMMEDIKKGNSYFKEIVDEYDKLSKGGS